MEYQRPDAAAVAANAKRIELWRAEPADYVEKAQKEIEGQWQDMRQAMGDAITGGCWYMKISYDPAYGSTAEFEAEGRPHAIRNRDGVIPIGCWYEGWESTRLCYPGEGTLSECRSLGPKEVLSE